MVAGALDFLLHDDALHEDDLAYFAFLERAQAMHIGVVDLVERGNPIASVTLLRAFAENLAVVYYLADRPSEVQKLGPGATQGFPIGRVIAAANKSLPGFKDLYAHWSNIAHPSGKGGFHTLDVSDDGTFTWQSHPKFRSLDDAHQILDWLSDLCSLTRQIIVHTGARLSNGTHD
ncbi:hypothetical protein GCM10009860_24810 [Microbacterium mitrae]